MGSDAARDKRLRFRYGAPHKLTRGCTRWLNPSKPRGTAESVGRVSVGHGEATRLCTRLRRARAFGYCALRGVRAGNPIRTIHIAGPTTSEQYGQAVPLRRVLGGIGGVATPNEIGSDDILDPIGDLGLAKRARETTALVIRN